jgi:hypothetical protein
MEMSFGVIHSDHQLGKIMQAARGRGDSRTAPAGFVFF